MSASSPEKVFPAAPAPGASSPAPGAGKFTLTGKNKKYALGAAAAVTVLLAATVGKRDGDTEEGDGEDNGGAYTLDTSDTDLASQLENITELLETDRPRPVTPTAPTAGTPTPNPAGPKRGGFVAGRTYRVKNGDTLKEVAKDLKVRGGAPRLYAINRKIIVRAAQQHKNPRPNTTRKLYAGTVLVIPSK